MKITGLFDKKFLRFFIVGTINTIIGSAIMFFLYNVIHLDYWISSACNYFLAGILSFFMNRYYTFEVRHWSVFMVVSYIVVYVFAYLLTHVFVKPAVSHILKDSPQKVCENIALFAGIFIFSGINYLGQRFIVFKKKH